MSASHSARSAISPSSQDSFSRAPAMVARPAAQRARPSLYPFPCFLVGQSASRMEALSECVMMARLPSVRSFRSLRVAAWICYTYLYNSHRDNPAFLNSTGLM